MKIDLGQFRLAFMQESSEHLNSIEVGLLELRQTPENSELLNAIFRAAHSIKGGAGTFRLSNVIRLAHSLENVLDRLRSEEIALTESIISLLLEAGDGLRALLELDATADMPEEALGVALQLDQLTTPAPTRSTTLLREPTPDPKEKCFIIDFLPCHDIFKSGNNPVLLLRNLAGLGTVTECRMETGNLPPLEELDPSQSYLSWTIHLRTAKRETEVREVFEFVEHLAEIRVRTLESDSQSVSDAETVTGAPAAEGPTEPPAPLVERTGDRKPSGMARQSLSADASTIRVSTEKVDRLIDLVGELVIAHVTTKQLTDNFTSENLPNLREAVAAMERNTRELHERVMGIRMLPVGMLFQRFKRTVFDIAQSTGKQIRLETSGEETEIDKSLLDLLGDPLIHLVRNAADHGIESPELRRSASKPEGGTIWLKARHRSGKVEIEISDDGGGIDLVRVHAKAVERGLVFADAKLNEEQILNFIFEPGFSTRDEVTDLSGRGVGMDVVRRNVQKLGGTIKLLSSLGEGSTIRLELPLTLAIMEGLLIRVEEETMVLPLLAVIEAVCPAPDQIVNIAGGGEMLIVRDEPIRLLRMSRLLGTTPLSDHTETDETDRTKASDSEAVVIVVEAGSHKLGLLVQGIIGQQQVVLKSLENNFRKLNGLMGVTILGDGRAAPVLDVAGLGSLPQFSPQASTHHAQQTATLTLATAATSH